MSMKTIFMCVNYPINEPAVGISKKIRDQIETFQKRGFEVTFSAYIDGGIAIYRNDRIMEFHAYHTKSEKMTGLERRFCLMRACAGYVSDKKYTIGYIRWDAVDRAFLNVLENMRRSCEKMVMETHGYFKGFRGTSYKGKYIEWTTKINGNRLSRYIDLILAESNESNIFGIPALKTDTGVDVSKYREHRYIGARDEIHMISVANETKYHGYDRLIRGIARYKENGGEIPVKLHLVGKMLPVTGKMIGRLNLKDCIILYGYQTGGALEEIYGKCNLGVGPLAPHRIGGKEGTGIKTKEYFAVGLPYFYAGHELLVPEDYAYVHRIKSEETPVDMDEIIRFYRAIADDEGARKNMRKFAQENFSWDKIYRNMEAALFRV